MGIVGAKMMRTVYFFIRFVVHLMMTVFISLRYFILEKQGKLKEQQEYLYEQAEGWGKFLIEKTGSKVRVIGQENIPEGAVLVISNHQSNFDIPLLVGYLGKPIGFVAKKELAKIPIMSTWMKRIHCVFIDRQNNRQAIKALAEAANSLKAGHSLVIFPEGTRSKKSTMGPFKKGSLRLAEKSGVPILPVTIIDSYKVYEGNNNRVQPANVQLIIEKPIDINQLDDEQKEQLLDQLREQFQKNLDTYSK